MPNLKLQVGRALKVIPSFDTNIPMPNDIITTAATGTATNKLVDTGANFSSVGNNPLNVKVGDTVYNTSASTAAMVVKVNSATQLSLNSDIMTSGQSYTLYSGTNIAGSIEPCVLYVGTGGGVELVTAGGDYVYLTNVPSGSFLPIQVIKVLPFTTASDIVALW